MAAGSISAWFRERFGRKTNSHRFIPEIDGLRFPAIAIVVVGHLAAYFIDRPGAPPPRGQLDELVVSMSAHAGEGVVLFFIISGFILALPFASFWLRGTARVGLRDYYMRRVTRLEPPYLISLAGFLALKVFARQYHLVAGTESVRMLIEHFAVSAVYLHSLVYGAGSIINGVAWSLEVEIQFYLLVPLATRVFAIRSVWLRRGVIVGAAVAAVVGQQLFVDGEGRYSLSVLGSAQYFLAGFLLADLYVSGWLADETRSFGWDAVSLVLWPTIALLWRHQPPTPVLLPLAAFAGFIAVFRGRWTNRVFRNAWITTIGGMCYSIYLLHFILISTTGKVLARRLPPGAVLWRDLAREGPPLLAVALAASCAFYMLVERPCMDRRWPSRLVSRVRSRFSGVAEAEAIGPEM